MADSAMLVAEQAKEDLVAEAAAPATEDLLMEDLLVEEVSIDGMCGVY